MNGMVGSRHVTVTIGARVTATAQGADFHLTAGKKYEILDFDKVCIKLQADNKEDGWFSLEFFEEFISIYSTVELEDQLVPEAKKLDRMNNGDDIVEVLLPWLDKDNDRLQLFIIREYDGSIYAEMDEQCDYPLKNKEKSPWIPFVTEFDEECGMDILQGPLPDDDQEILISVNGASMSDTFLRDGNECYLDSGHSFIDEVQAWMPMPDGYHPER